MRVKPERREATRKAILRGARKSFARQVFDRVTTRALASQARIAAGTLFNYFPTKEALAIELLADDASAALDAFEPRSRGEESLAEDLFALVLATLRAMAPLRRTVGPVLASSLGPWTVASPDVAAARMRLRVLRAVRSVLSRHGVPFGEDPVAAHLFWTLYLGALAFWCSDTSPEQEDTLVLLDQSMRLFAGSLPAGPGVPEVNHDE